MLAGQILYIQKGYFQFSGAQSYDLQLPFHKTHLSNKQDTRKLEYLKMQKGELPRLKCFHNGIILIVICFLK